MIIEFTIISSRANNGSPKTTSRRFGTRKMTAIQHIWKAGRINAKRFN